MFLNLQKDDKIILPNTLDVNGKSHQLTNVDSRKANRYKGLSNIEADLNRIKTSIQSFIQKTSHDFEQFRSSIITYRKLFIHSKGRHAKLERQRDLKGASQHLLDIHKMLIELGNQYIAHAEDSLYDQSSVVLILDDNKKAVGISVFRMTLENFEPNKYPIWLEIIDLLKKNLTLILKKLSNSIINEYNTPL